MRRRATRLVSAIATLAALLGAATTAQAAGYPQGQQHTYSIDVYTARIGLNAADVFSGLKAGQSPQALGLAQAAAEPQPTPDSYQLDLAANAANTRDATARAVSTELAPL